jgi:hypothetical protein
VDEMPSDALMVLLSDHEYVICETFVPVDLESQDLESRQKKWWPWSLPISANEKPLGRPIAHSPMRSYPGALVTFWPTPGNTASVKHLITISVVSSSPAAKTLLPFVAWPQAQAKSSNLRFGLRLKNAPQICPPKQCVQAQSRYEVKEEPNR